MIQKIQQHQLSVRDRQGVGAALHMVDVSGGSTFKIRTHEIGAITRRGWPDTCVKNKRVGKWNVAKLTHDRLLFLENCPLLVEGLYRA